MHGPVFPTLVPPLNNYAKDYNTPFLSLVVKSAMANPAAKKKRYFVLNENTDCRGGSH